MIRSKRISVSVVSAITTFTRDSVIQNHKAVVSSVDTWLRYREFLQILQERHLQTKRIYGDLMHRIMSSAEDPEVIPSLFQDLIEAQWQVNLEIESVYLYGKILLDRIADTF